MFDAMVILKATLIAEVTTEAQLGYTWIYGIVGWQHYVPDYVLWMKSYSDRL